jgi:site-specific DNA-methyltransferase (adenine-specific)
MELMSRYPDKYFDLAIVDPPYGINRSGQRQIITKNPKHKRKYFKNKGWDNEIPKKEYFDQLFRVSKNQIIWGANYFTQYLPSSMGWIFWDKGQDLTMSDGELAFTSFEIALRRKIINRNQLIVDGGTQHPTQKPILLYKWILDKYAKQGDKILDTHLGSGSIAIACHDYGFELTACELDKEYYDSAIKRIKNHVSQQKLF